MAKKRAPHIHYGNDPKQTVGYRQQDLYPVYIHGWDRHGRRVEIALTPRDADDLVFKMQQLRRRVSAARTSGIATWSGGDQP